MWLAQSALGRLVQRTARRRFSHIKRRMYVHWYENRRRWEVWWSDPAEHRDVAFAVVMAEPGFENSGLDFVEIVE